MAKAKGKARVARDLDLVVRVLVCGSRDWGDIAPIRDRLRELVDETGIDNLIVITGGARGADQLAAVVAEQLDVHCAVVKALWRGKRRRAAGPKRNDAMLALAPDLVLAFHEDLAKSKGTMDTVSKARKLGIDVEVVTGRG